MMRTKIPNGIVTSAQVRFLANMTGKYGEEGCTDITTRQNFQMRGIVLPDVPEILEARRSAPHEHCALFLVAVASIHCAPTLEPSLCPPPDPLPPPVSPPRPVAQGMEAVGLSTIQSGLDNVRNPVGSPIAGIDPHEIIDTRPFLKSINDFTVNMGRGNPEIANLPRKWNVCVVGSHDLYEHPHINDLAFVPATKDGVLGFNIWVGGLLTATRRGPDRRTRPSRWGGASLYRPLL